METLEIVRILYLIRFRTSQVKKMNALSLEREKEFQVVKKKLAAMEKLNRALQEERASLIKGAKTTTNGVD